MGLPGEFVDAADAADAVDAADAGLLAVGQVLALSVGLALWVADGLALWVADGLAVGVADGLTVGEAEAVAAGTGVCDSAEAMLNPPKTVRPRAPVMAQAAVEREIFMVLFLSLWLWLYKTGKQ